MRLVGLSKPAQPTDTQMARAPKKADSASARRLADRLRQAHCRRYSKRM